MNTPYGEPCLCGAELIEHAADGPGWYFRCCALTYVGEKIVSVGPVRLDAPLLVRGRPTAAQINLALAGVSAPPEGMTTALYRRSDADKTLLYIGISDALRTRTSFHIRKSAWFQFATEVEVEWFATRKDAERAETAAIKAERPLFNRQHAPIELRAAAVRYLEQRGALDMDRESVAPASGP